MRHDRFRILERVAVLALKLAQRLLRVVLELLRLVELGFDLGRALVEHAREHLPDALRNQHDRDHEGDRDRELGIVEQLADHPARSLMT